MLFNQRHDVIVSGVITTYNIYIFTEHYIMDTFLLHCSYVIYMLLTALAHLLRYTFPSYSLEPLNYQQDNGTDMVMTHYCVANAEMFLEF